MGVEYSLDRKDQPRGMSRSSTAEVRLNKKNATAAITTIAETIWAVQPKIRACRQMGMPW